MTKIVFTESIIDGISPEEAAEVLPRVETALYCLDHLHDKLVGLPASEHLAKVESFQSQLRDKIEYPKERVSESEEE